MRDLPPRDAFEARFVRPHARAGRTLIAGSRVYGGKEDRRALYADAVGVDMLAGAGVDVVHDLELPPPPGLGAFVHVECLSVLEHARRPWLVAETIERLMLPGATLYLSVPFIWRVHDYPGDLFRFTDQGVRAMFPGIAWRALRYASDRLRPDGFVKAIVDRGYPYLPRTEVVGLGIRSA